MTRSETAGLRLRPGVPADAEAIHAAILRLGDVLGTGGKIRSTVEDFRRHGFGPDAAFATLIAEVDGAFAGVCLSFPIFSTWLGRPGVYVQDLYVEARFRGRKVGEALLRAVAAQARARGAAYLRLSVDADNAGAQSFYERLGIARLGDEHAHGAYGEAFEALSRGPDRDARAEEPQ